MSLGQLGRSQGAHAARSGAVTPCVMGEDAGRAELERLRARVRADVIPGLEALANPTAAVADLIALADHQSRRLRAELEPADGSDALFGRAGAEDPASAAAREWVRQHLHDTALQALEHIAGNAFGEGLEASKIAGLAGFFASDLRRWVEAADGPTNTKLLPELERVTERARSLDPRVELVAETDTRLPPEHVEAIAGAVCEAVNNARKHANATNVFVRVVKDSEGRTAVTVTDDGIGIDLEQAAQGGGLGVKGSIVGRMERVGGEASIEDAPGGGTLVTLVTPRQGG